MQKQHVFLLQHICDLFFTNFYRFFFLQVYLTDGNSSFRVAITDNLFLCLNPKSHKKNEKFQIFQLKRYPEISPPSLVRKSRCLFPKWLSKFQGKLEKKRLGKML